MIVADNGSAWFISGAPDDRWNNDNLGTLRNIHGSDFEAVDDSGFQLQPNTAQGATCDLNDSGGVDVLDLQIAINEALGTTACNTGDLDGNGTCNIIDVQRVVSAALGSPCRIGP
jgi:hypothetical protein